MEDTENKEHIKKACELIRELININPQINIQGWITSFQAYTVRCYVESGISYEDYLCDMNRTLNVLKRQWPDDEKT